MSPFKNMGRFRREKSPGVVVAGIRDEEQGAVKEQYADHVAEQKVKEEEWERIVALDVGMVEKMADRALIQEAEQVEHQEQDASYADITSDEEFFRKKRWKELRDAIQEELHGIREYIKRGGEEDVEEVLQDGKYDHFDQKAVAQVIRYTIKNLEKDVDLKERLGVALEKVLEKIVETRILDRTVFSLKGSASAEVYRNLLVPGKFRHFSQGDVARRIVQSGSYFSEELFDKALLSLYLEDALEDPLEGVDSGAVVEGQAETSEEGGLKHDVREDDSDHDERADYGGLLKNTDVSVDRGRKKEERQKRREDQEIDALLSEAVHGTSDAAEIAAKRDHFFRVEGAIGGHDPYYMRHHRVNVYAAARTFRDLLEKDYKHSTREEVAEKIRNALVEADDDTLYVAFRRAIRDLRRKEQQGLDYDLEGEDALIGLEGQAIEREERLEILHQWKSVLSRSFFNQENAQEYAAERRVCVREMQRVLTALLHRERLPDLQHREVQMEEYQRDLVWWLLKGVVYVPKGDGEYDEFALKKYFQPEEVVAVMLHAIEWKEDQELYAVISEMLANEEINPNTFWIRAMKVAWQSLARKSFLSSHQSQQFAEGRKKQMQAVQDEVSHLVNNGGFSKRLLYGGGYGGYHGYKYTTPKEVAATAVYLIEGSEEQEGYDLLMRGITEEERDLQEGHQVLQEQMREKKDELKEYRAKNQEQAKSDVRLQKETERAEAVARQAVATWKERVGI